MFKICFVYIVTLFYMKNIIGAPQTGSGEEVDPKTLNFLLPNYQKNLNRCTGAKGETGTCVPIKSCILKELKEDYVKYQGYFCVRDKKEVGVCCPNDLEFREKRETTVAPSAISINEIGNESEGDPDYSQLADYIECGYSSKNIEEISQGRAAVRDWPWMAVIIRKEDMFHFCGGALITKRFILTASHCVARVQAPDIVVRVGEYDFSRTNDSRHVDMIASEIIMHEDYDSATYEHDIALILLKTNVRYNIFVHPLCLPLPGPKYDNTSVIVAGWGTTQYGGPMSDILLEVNVPVWEQEKCVDSFTQTVFDSNMCAGGFEGGKDSCQGDSGGPLMSQRKDRRWMTIGVVSWGIKCGEKGKPGVYTRVNHYLPWIAEKLIQHKPDI